MSGDLPRHLHLPLQSGSDTILAPLATMRGGGSPAPCTAQSEETARM